MPRVCDALTALQLWEKFRPGQPVPTDMGRSNEYNVDAVRALYASMLHCFPWRDAVVYAASFGDCFFTSQVPKFIMANGKLVQMLVVRPTTP